VFAARGVVFKHLRVPPLEFEGDAFAHHAYAVHRVDERLRFALKKISDQRFEHGLRKMRLSEE
jgi:hypothetical protein